MALYRAFFALLSVVSAGHAQAQSSHTECVTLEEALRLSVINSPEVNAAEANRDRALADLTDARSVRRPQLSAFARTQAGDEGLTGAGVENTVGLRASQRLYDFGSSRLNREASESLLKARRFAIISAETRAALQTAEAFIGVLEINARLAITAEREDFFARQFEATSNALEIGGATRADVAEIAARLADAEADRLELAFERDRLSTALASDLGEAVSPCLGDLTGLANADEGIANQVNLALGNNSELQVVSAEIEAQEARVKRAERNHLPAIDLVGIASYAYDDHRNDWDFRDRIGIDVSVPLVSGNALNADRRRASADLASRRSESAALRRELIEVVEVSSRRLISLGAQLVRRRTVADRQAEQFDAAQAEFEAGLRTLPELVDDRLELENARLEVVNIEFERALETINLRALTGKLVQ